MHGLAFGLVLVGFMHGIDWWVWYFFMDSDWHSEVFRIMLVFWPVAGNVVQ